MQGVDAKVNNIDVIPDSNDRAIECKVYYSDEAVNKYTESGDESVIVPSMKSTGHMHPHFAGKCRNLKIELKTDLNSEINSIQVKLNYPAKFSFDIFHNAQLIWVMPIMAFLAQMLTSALSLMKQKKLNPDSPNMAGMMLTMPLLSLFIGFTLPGGVAFYWTCSSLIGGFIQVGVQQFLFMSSMIVYSGCKEKKITENTIPKPLNFYGDSKWQADQKIQALADERFKVVVLRPPMIYGKGSKGNYPQLAKLAGKLPLFPIVHNQRSMLYIENLAQFVKRMIDNEETGVFFPQNEQYINTSDLVQMIAMVKGHRLVMVPATGWIIRLMKKIPGKIGTLMGKAFGDSVYDMQMSEYKEEYRVCDWKESVRRTEG